MGTQPQVFDNLCADMAAVQPVSRRYRDAFAVVPRWTHRAPPPPPRRGCIGTLAKMAWVRRVHGTVCEQAWAQRRDRHWETRSALQVRHDQLKVWLVDGGLTAVKAIKLLAAREWWSPNALCSARR
jgi:hypothetical protein